MQSRIIEKIIEVEGRRFLICKFPAFTGVKVAKLMASKILPLFQSFLPALSRIMGSQSADTEFHVEQFMESLDQYISLEGISRAIDHVTGEDLDFLMQSALLYCSEQLPAGSAAVLCANGTFGVKEVEHDPMLMLRLVCEALLWGLGDFFIAERWTSIMKPLLVSFRQNLPT